MRIRELISIAIALTAFGCSKAPEAVFVDLDRIARSEIPVSPVVPNLGDPQDVIILPRVASLPRTSGIVILDQAGGKIDVARRLIEADRDLAIRTLSQRLQMVQTDIYDAERIKALDELERAQAAKLTEIYAQLLTIFQDYAAERGPASLRADVLQVRNPDLYPSRNSPQDFVKLTAKKPISGTPVEVPPDKIPPSFADQQRAELARLESLIGQLDAEYNRRARELLDTSSAQIEANERAILEEIERRRIAAIEQARRDARQTIEKRKAPTDLDLGQNRSVVVSAVEGRTVGIAGSKAKREPIVPLPGKPLINEAQMRQSLNEQLEIWLKTRGLVRAAGPRAGRDATDEFDEWRTSHRLGT